MSSRGGLTGHALEEALANPVLALRNPHLHLMHFVVTDGAPCDQRIMLVSCCSD